MTPLNNFRLYSATQIQSWLEQNPKILFDLVRDTYLLHSENKTTNPDSYFLRFPKEPNNRVIALASVIDDEKAAVGLKWIASFPDNIKHNKDRASAVMIVNDRNTGYPLACLEGSLISAARTAASAAVGLHYLHPNTYQINKLGVIGCGLIAMTTIRLLTRLGWNINEVLLTDTNLDRADEFRKKLLSHHAQIKVKVCEISDVLSESDASLFATSSITPYIKDEELFVHNPTVIHLSLRDLSTNIIRKAQNIADDIDHCLKANTSLHLTEQEDGNRNFISHSISDLILGKVKPDFNRLRIYSPFGMGILDLAIARDILSNTEIRPAHTENNFFPTPYAQQ